MSDIKAEQVRCVITGVDGRAHEVMSVAADRQPVDPRMQVVLGLLPEDAVFIVRRGYVVDADGDSPTHVDALLWRPKSSGYVSEYNPWQAGLYTPADKDYRPRGEDPDAHSYTVSVQGYLVGAIQDDTPLAVLVDEIVRLRALVDAAARGES